MAGGERGRACGGWRGWFVYKWRKIVRCVTYRFDSGCFFFSTCFFLRLGFELGALALVKCDGGGGCGGGGGKVARGFCEFRAIWTRKR